MGDQATYNYKVVRQFAVMTVVWGVVGMLVGVIIAAQRWRRGRFDIDQKRPPGDDVPCAYVIRGSIM